MKKIMFLMLMFVGLMSSLYALDTFQESNYVAEKVQPLQCGEGGL